jgi:hypothetical protein
MAAQLPGCRTPELNPAYLFSKPVGSGLIFGEPAVRFYLVAIPIAPPYAEGSYKVLLA